jgi:rhamnosyltransferase
MRLETCAVVVTYDPDAVSIRNVVASLHGQVDAIVIVDNASKNLSDIELVVQNVPVELIKFSENKGISSAQNTGISYAISQGAKYILLMDQDTVLPEGTVHVLRDECVSLEDQGVKVGAIGCAYRDTHGGKINAVWKANGYKVEKQDIEPNTKQLLAVDFVIASGSLIPTVTLKEVGLMDEDLFIDLVDVEWGLRAKARGYQSYQSFKNIMKHTLGNGRLNILGKTVALHSPVRNYYSIRNSILLARRRYIGTAWRLYFIRRIFPYLIVFGLFSNQKRPRINFMIRGLKDGLFSHVGQHRP